MQVWRPETASTEKPSLLLADKKKKFESTVYNSTLLCWLKVLHLGQKLWSCWDGHIFLLVTDNKPWISGKWRMNDRGNNFMINLHESMGPCGDQTRNSWICSRTRFWQRYRAQYIHIIIIVTWSGVLYHVKWMRSYHRITRDAKRRGWSNGMASSTRSDTVCLIKLLL